jgi:hypothetical protein
LYFRVLAVKVEMKVIEGREHWYSVIVGGELLCLLTRPFGRTDALRREREYLAAYHASRCRGDAGVTDARKRGFWTVYR